MMMAREYIKDAAVLGVVATLLFTDWITVFGAVTILLILVKNVEISNQLRKEYITDFILIGATLALYAANWITILGTGIILILIVNSIIDKYLDSRGYEK